MDSSLAQDPLPVALLGELAQSAASGLVWHAGALLVIADDELTLARYDLNGRLLGTTRLLAGELPSDPVQRKRKKHDFEAIVAIADRVLVLGSGSKGHRRNLGVWFDPNAEHATRVDLAPLYEELASHADRVNVEGAVLVDERLVLLTRRTGNRGRNLLVYLDTRRVRKELGEEEPRLGKRCLLDVVPVELGELEGVPLGFTDGTAAGGRILFSAAAEATDDPVLDGVCKGSVLGLVDLDGTVVECRRLTTAAKIEGVCSVSAPAGTPELRLVADPDDPTKRAPLFAAPILLS